jgi:predicted glycosyltransferase
MDKCIFSKKILNILTKLINEDISRIIFGYLISENPPKIKIIIDIKNEMWMATCPFCKNVTSSDEYESFILDSSRDKKILYCDKCNNIMFLPIFIEDYEHHEHLYEEDYKDDSLLLKKFMIKENTYEIPLLKIISTTTMDYADYECDRRLSLKTIREFMEAIKKVQTVACREKEEKEIFRKYKIVEIYEESYKMFNIGWPVENYSFSPIITPTGKKNETNFIKIKIFHSFR